jgi:DNA-binding transcriptional ArsR family regulator
MTPVAPGMDDIGQQTRAAAFRLLLETGRAVSAAQIAADLNAAPSAVEAELRRLDAAGRIRLSADGHVVGSAGLSVVPAAHELWLGSRRFWTWCAYDVVGIVGTLRADARSLSRSPATGAQIRLQFAAGRPPATPVVVFFPDDGGATRSIDDWCSNANFFETREAALSWSAQRKMEGEVIELDEARRRGQAHWGPLLSANRGFGSREDHGDDS